MPCLELLVPCIEHMSCPRGAQNGCLELTAHLSELTWDLCGTHSSSLWSSQHTVTLTVCLCGAWSARTLCFTVHLCSHFISNGPAWCSLCMCVEHTRHMYGVHRASLWTQCTCADLVAHLCRAHSTPCTYIDFTLHLYGDYKA